MIGVALTAIFKMCASIDAKSMIEHKAFLFEFDGFEAELLPLLQAALVSGDCAGLIGFVRQNAASLTDPYEGNPLPEGWEGMIESPDAHQYGDFALTKYFNPADDIGLGSSWDQVQQVVASGGSADASPILGSIVGPSGNPFDPGRLGSYFQSAQQAIESLRRLRQLVDRNPTEAMNEAVALLERAAAARTGLYVTF